ncbi:MAG: peptidylprolyl isomerase [Candidatus Heteroscillospira sp.]|jgi:parvulin-like peptidyl-prolyl isomerase
MSAAKNKKPETGSSKRNKILGTIAAILVVLLIAGSFLINSDYFYTKTAAVSIGSTDYTTAEFNYFYRTAYNQFYSQLGDYASMIIDSSKPLDEQYYVEGQSYHDYFTEAALTQMTEVTVAYDNAVAKGLSLSEENKTAIADEMANVDIYASIYGLSADKYLAQIYGSGMDKATLESIMNRVYLASQFYSTEVESYSYTEEELKAAYAEGKDDYDIFTYRVFYVPNNDDAEAAYADADAIANAKDGEEFAQLVREHASEDSASSYADDDSTLYTSAGANLGGYDYGDWLKEAGRKDNETTVMESSSGEGYYVVMFVGRDSNDYNTRSMRHILIEVEEDDNDGYTQENIDAAKAKIDEIKAAFDATDKTEESFANLANEKSEDPGSNTNGGLYEHIARNQMVQPVNDFVFADDRKSGDTGIVYYEGDNYAGYHLIYFVGEGEPYCDYIADNSLRSADYSEWIESQKANYPVEQHFSMRFVETNFSMNIAG